MAHGRSTKSSSRCGGLGLVGCGLSMKNSLSLGFRVECLRFRVWDLRSSDEGLGFGVQGLGFGV
jgi:hypothetical protein